MYAVVPDSQKTRVSSIMHWNSAKSTRPSPFRSTELIMQRQSSMVKPFSPKPDNTRCSSSAEMKPFPSMSNTWKAALMSSPELPAALSALSMASMARLLRLINSWRSMNPSPSASTSSTISWSSLSVDSIPREWRTKPSSVAEILPSPFISKYLNASVSSSVRSKGATTTSLCCSSDGDDASREALEAIVARFDAEPPDLRLNLNMTFQECEESLSLEEDDWHDHADEDPDESDEPRETLFAFFFFEKNWNFMLAGRLSRRSFFSGRNNFSDQYHGQGRYLRLSMKLRTNCCALYKSSGSPTSQTSISRKKPPPAPQKKKKKTLQMVVFNHTLPQCSCFTESCKFNEGEQRWKILPEHPDPKNAVKTQNKVATWPGASRRLKWITSLTVQMQQKGFSITNFLLDLGRSPFFLHWNSYWSESQALASRHKLLTPGAKRRRHKRAGGGDLKFKQGQKRLVPRSEKRSSVSTEFSKAATETQEEKSCQCKKKLPDTSWHSYNDRFKSDGRVGRPDRHTTQKTPFPWILSFVPSFPLRSCNNNNDTTAYMWILFPSFFPSPVGFFFFLFFIFGGRIFATSREEKTEGGCERCIGIFYFFGGGGESGTTSPHYEEKKS